MVDIKLVKLPSFLSVNVFFPVSIFLHDCRFVTRVSNGSQEHDSAKGLECVSKLISLPLTCV